MAFNLGIIGLGHIANKMADTAVKTDGVRLYAVASRTLEKAEEFGKSRGAIKCYGSYEELAEDKDVDLIYIATPHAFHSDIALMCLDKGKNVLIEKPAAVNGRQAREIFKKAEEKNLFAGEAMWSRFLPLQKTVNDIIKSGEIGEVVSVTANTGGYLSNVPRLILPELAGGALLDVGIYSLNFASMIIDEPIEKISTDAILTEKGIDAQNAFIITYKSGKMAILGSSILSESDLKAVVYGTKGRIEGDFIFNFSKIKVITPEGNRITEKPKQITGFEYELLSAVKAISEGKTESPEMPHSETVKMLDIMDRLRNEWGVRYPFE